MATCIRRWFVSFVVLALCSIKKARAFALLPLPRASSHALTLVRQQKDQFWSARASSTRRYLSDYVFVVVNDDDDDEEDVPDEEENDDDDEESDDPYTQFASSEFLDNPKAAEGSLVSASNEPTTSIDWGGALGKLRERVDDMESGKSQDPSHALFRLLSSQSPNQMVGSFVSTAKPEIVQAMGGAVGSLLGGLSNPASGIETIVKAGGDRIGSLCFQLQMTGYMFRNAEYIVALRELMDLRGSATLEDYRDAFERLDSDNSGYIDPAEIRVLLDDVYNGKTPMFEIDTFIKFFDKNNDGKISWDEFERGLGVAMSQQGRGKSAAQKLLSAADDDDSDDDDDIPELETEVTGTIEIEMADGHTVEVDAKEYIQSLKDEAQALKEALNREKRGNAQPQSMDIMSGGQLSRQDNFAGITEYIASRQGDVKALTEGISPEIVETMKLLVDFVLDRGDSRPGKEPPKREEIEMEIPASALQQLALWQLILGYRLREAEAKGDYRRLLD